MPLSQRQMEQVSQSTSEWISRAATQYKCKLSPVDIRFDLRGRTSGMFCYSEGASFIRYNKEIFARYFDESLAQTVPHEVAHYVVFKLYSKRAKPHGKEWRQVMQDFGVPASVTCKLDLSGIPQKKLRRFPYRCGCASHQLTSIRHNRVIKGIRGYACPKCLEPLVADPGI